MDDKIRNIYFDRDHFQTEMEAETADNILGMFIEARKSMRLRFQFVGPRTAFMYYLQGYLGGVRMCNEAQKIAAREAANEPMAGPGGVGPVSEGVVDSTLTGDHRSGTVQNDSRFRSDPGDA